MHDAIVVLGVALITTGACTSAHGTAEQKPVNVPPAETHRAHDRELIGEVTREDIETALPGWRQAREQATPSQEKAKALLGVPKGGSVVVYLGTWCGDSREEVPRLWKAFDMAGSKLPFTVRYVSVDHSMQAPPPARVIEDLKFVPTFVVERAGREVGRIVESAPGGVEGDLLDLLTGTKAGVISGRAELAPK
jgi:hypothetical protein